MEKREGSIGIYGGTFDPLHSGHIDVALQVKEEFQLQSVWMMVAADPPHKHGRAISPAGLRLEMAKIAVLNNPELTVCDLELNRSGPSYTVDTLRQIKGEHPGVKLYLILGGDMVQDLPNWRQPEDILAQCDIIAVERPGTPETIVEYAEDIYRRYGSRVLLSRVTGPDISATRIRDHMREALPIEGWVSAPLERYLYEQGVYFPEDLRRMQEKLKGMLNYERYRHSMGTVRCAIALARRYGVDGRKARLAALLHDCGKTSKKQAILLARELAVDVDPIEWECPGLLHAKIGECIAQKEFGITDREVLNAIRYHTVGRVNMTPLEKIIYLADMIEPTRVFEGVEALRQMERASLDEVVYQAMELCILDVKTRGLVVHPASIEAQESIKTKGEKH